jgi:hypothetical protein
MVSHLLTERKAMKSEVNDKSEGLPAFIGNDEVTWFEPNSCTRLRSVVLCGFLELSYFHILLPYKETYWWSQMMN